MKRHFIVIMFLFTISSVSSAKVKIAFIEGFSGSDPHTARELFRGAEVFIASNPEAAKNIEVLKYDLGGTLGEGATTVQKALKDGLKIFVGAGKSDDAIAVAKLLDGKALFITPFATNKKVTEGRSTVFRVCFSDDSQGEGLAELVKTYLKPEKIVVLRNIQSNYSVGLSETFMKNLEQKVTVIDYSGDQLESSKLSALVIARSPSLVFIPDHITRASVIAKAIHSRDPSVAFLGGDGFGGQKMFLGVMGQEKSIKLTYSTHWHSHISNRVNATFKKFYSQLYPSDIPTSGAAMAYDSLNILSIILKSNSYRVDVPVLSGLLKGKKFETTVGEVNFPSTPDYTPKKPLVFLQYSNGKYGVLEEAK